MGRSHCSDIEKVNEGVQQFALVTVAHPLLAAAKETLLSAINNAPLGSIIMVFGPTGVGKTTLCLKIQQLLVEQARPVMEMDSGRLPFVSLEVAAPDSGNFSWRDYYRRVLTAMAEPMLEDKIKPKAERRQSEQMVAMTRGGSVELRHAAELAIRHRQPAAILIDEAQHLTRMVSGRRLIDQLDVIKSLANCTRTIHVLLGTYELLALRHLNGQLGRRTIDINFRRYGAGNPADVHIFKNAVLTFQKHLPLPGESNLLQMWELLFERSVGCIGILKEWLQRALFLALHEKCQSLNESHLERTALSAAQCEKIVIEAHEGEAHFASSDQSRSRLRSLLGLNSVDEVAAKHPEPRKDRVGQRRPTRDPIGKSSASAGEACHGV
jgi:energy-coupling factor transporter ATP-binding protein EcfA2